jgi:hypothetical protein
VHGEREVRTSLASPDARQEEGAYQPPLLTVPVSEETSPCGATDHQDGVHANSAAQGATPVGPVCVLGQARTDRE